VVLSRQVQLWNPGDNPNRASRMNLDPEIVHDQSGVCTSAEGILGNAMLRYASEMAMLMDCQRRIVQMNAAAQALFGGDNDSMLGKEPSGMLAELMAELPVDDYLAQPAGQSLRSFIRFLQQYGKDRFFQIKMAPWPFDDAGWGLVILIEDTTQRRTAELALAECRHSFREVFRNIQDIFYRSDIQGNLVMASDSLARLLGYDSVDECIGLNAAETFYLNPGDRSEMLEHLRREGSVWDYEVLLKRKDGTPVPVSMNSHVYYSADGTELGVEGMIRDVSERRAARDCIHQHVEKIVELSRELLDFVDHPSKFR
jgi:PAS domain S-box-containing protein